MIKKTIGWEPISALVVVMLSLTWGCSTYVYNHQKTKAEKFYKKHPGDLARICADSFTLPTQLFIGRDSVVTDTLYSGFDRQVAIADTGVFVGHITADGAILPFGVSDVTHPSLWFGTAGIQSITITHHRVDTLKIENVAKYDSLRNYLKTKADSIGSLKKQLSDKTAESKKYYGDAVARLWIIIGICVIAAVLIFLKFYL